MQLIFSQVCIHIDVHKIPEIKYESRKVSICADNLSHTLVFAYFYFNVDIVIG